MKHKLTRSGLMVLALFLLLGSTVLASSTWYVNGVNGNDNNNCMSPQTACKTIGHAISLASSGDSIIVASATYTENLTISISLTIVGAGANTTIIDGGKKNTVVSIPNAGIRVKIMHMSIQNGSTFNASGSGIDNNGGMLAINDSNISGNTNQSGAGVGGGIFNNGGALTITNSKISGNSAPSGGGGIYNNGGTVTITNSTLSGNTFPSGAPGDGGGIYNNAGKLTITSSDISRNSASGGGGIENNGGTLTVTNIVLNRNTATLGCGGIDSYGGMLTINHSNISGNTSGQSGSGICNAYGTLTINNSTLSGNTTTSNGGAIDNEDGTLTITNSNISRNTAYTGGGIYNVGGPSTVTNTILNGNTATFATFGFGGGGIENNGGTLTITNSNISGNTAFGGGGIYNTGVLRVTNSILTRNMATLGSGGGLGAVDGTVIINDSTFIGNVTGTSDPCCGGGAISNDGVGKMSVVNSTISGNAGKGFGGGIENSATLELENVTVSGNGAPSGGGAIYALGGGVVVQNTIVANSPKGGNCYGNGGIFISNGYNLNSDNTCHFYNTGDLNNTDPKLGPLQDNGGPTYTQALLAGSPAIDAGNPSGCKASNGVLLTSDQRGMPRPDKEDLGVGCDIGAYELQIAP
jgi:predicted outer membrane repeat protein